jgi:hypothetical protein
MPWLHSPTSARYTRAGHDDGLPWHDIGCRVLQSKGVDLDTVLDTALLAWHCQRQADEAALISLIRFGPPPRLCAAPPLTAAGSGCTHQHQQACLDVGLQATQQGIREATSAEGRMCQPWSAAVLRSAAAELVNACIAVACCRSADNRVLSVLLAI